MVQEEEEEEEFEISIPVVRGGVQLGRPRGIL